MKTTSLVASLALGLAGPALAAEDTPPALPDLTLDPTAISVMGVSSGGYMATQLAVAYPALFQGLAVFAAGPWGCAQGELSRALGQCMTTRRGLPEPSALAARLEGYREQGLAGSAEALADQRVYLWHGDADATVAPALGDRLAEQYRGWLAAPEAQLQVVRQAGAGHGWPVDAEALSRASGETSTFVDCRDGGAPYLLDCGLDGAGAALAWLQGEDGNEGESQTRTLAAAGEARPEHLRAFDQTPFDDDLAERGHVYVPASCASGEACGLVVALHGCNMSTDAIGETFVRHAGLNRWAESNDLVVLYPQVTASLANPQGCWDWWGYEESLWQPKPRHDSRAGEQLTALVEMVRRLSDRGDESDGEEAAAKAPTH